MKEFKIYEMRSIVASKHTTLPKKSPRYAKRNPFIGIPTRAYMIMTIRPRVLEGEMFPQPVLNDDKIEINFGIRYLEHSLFNFFHTNSRTNSERKEKCMVKGPGHWLFNWILRVIRYWFATVIAHHFNHIILIFGLRVFHQNLCEEKIFWLG